MATITIEIGKKNAKKTRSVSFLVCHKKTKKRISTEISLHDTEITPNGRIKHYEKARIIEEMHRKLQDKLFEIAPDLLGKDVDAAYIVSRISSAGERPDFFTFTDWWMEHAKTKAVKNYKSMLNALEKYLGCRSLPFDNITYPILQGFMEHLKDRPRAMTLYLGQMRHLHREAMRKYNTEHEQAIDNDPFLRFRVPKQVLKKGVRSLALEDFMKVCAFRGEEGGRAQLARDCFVLSFCLMGMNSVDLYNCKEMSGRTIKYNRTKTKDRRSDGAYIEVVVHPQIAAIVEKYRDKAKGGRVFNFSRRYASPSYFNSALNKGLKEVGRSSGIDGLEFYQARHTFATLSRNLMRFSKSDVDEALNHVGTMEIADIYIAKDFGIINENNAKLLARVFGESTETSS